MHRMKRPIGELARRVAYACQESKEHHHRAHWDRPIAHLKSQQVGFLIQNEIPSRNDRHADDPHSQQFGAWLDQGIIESDLHRLAIVFFGRLMKSVALVPFHRKGLDDLNAVKGLFRVTAAQSGGGSCSAAITTEELSDLAQGTIFDGAIQYISGDTIATLHDWIELGTSRNVRVANEFDDDTGETLKLYGWELDR